MSVTTRSLFFSLSSLLPLGLAAVLLAAGAGPALAYTYHEILDIYRASGRKLFRDTRLATAMKELRDSRILYMKSPELGPLVAQVETPRVLAALRALHEAGLLPPASTKLDTVHLESDLLMSDAGSPGRSSEPIYRTGRVMQPIPFYEKIERAGYFILGGLLPAGTEFEVATAVGGAALVTFESRPSAYISMGNVDDLGQTTYTDKQAQTGVQERRELGSARYFKVRHEHAEGRVASLSILWVPLGPTLTVRPHATSRYDLIERGAELVSYVDDISRETGALAAVNGTFFIVAPRKSHDGMPLGPVLRDGKLVWSYSEKRVLDMNRAYLAITTDNRAVLGETTQPGEVLVRLNEQRTLLDGTPLAGAKVRDLIGGFGWLVKSGDEEAWRHYAGSQFWYTYYSHHVKRPQTVLGVAEDGRSLVFVAQEGRPHSPDPMSLPMLARYLKTNFAVRDAVFLDGGGSSSMAIEGRHVTRPENDGGYRKTSTAILVMAQ